MTDTNSRAVPCEDMLATLTTALATTTVTGADLTAAADFQTKALERYNADDDARVDGFSVQPLALVAISLTAIIGIVAYISVTHKGKKLAAV